MDSATLGRLGGILGALIGVLGGVIGTYFSIRNTKTPAERRFMIRMSALMWAAGLVLVALPMGLMIAGIIPRWSYWIPLTLFFVVLGPMIRWGNKRQSELRG